MARFTYTKNNEETQECGADVLRGCFEHCSLEDRLVIEDIIAGKVDSHRFRYGKDVVVIERKSSK